MVGRTGNNPGKPTIHATTHRILYVPIDEPSVSLKRPILKKEGSRSPQQQVCGSYGLSFVGEFFQLVSEVRESGFHEFYVPPIQFMAVLPQP